jgi:hypothetical protein
LGLCTCNYTCGLKPSSGPQERKCKSGLGVCNNQCDNACCNRKCASRFYQGIGDCSTVGGSPYRLCTCYYDGVCHWLIFYKRCMYHHGEKKSNQQFEIKMKEIKYELIYYYNSLKVPLI